MENNQMENNIKLSILVPSIPSRRYHFLNSFLDRIEHQINNIKRNDIELLLFYENKKRILGEKRNNLMDLAKGKFLTFIDDDDRISEDYLTSIMNEIDLHDNCDCIVFDCICTINGENPHHCKYGIEYPENNAKYPKIWTGKPRHTMVFKTDLARKFRFPILTFGEDIQWANLICHSIKHQRRINKVLYHYEYNSSTTETRGGK
jgi:hypothetical protein